MRKKFSIFIRLVIKTAVIPTITLSAVFLLFYGQAFANSKDADQKKILDEQTQQSGILKIGEQLEKYAEKNNNEILTEIDPKKILEEASTGRFSPDPGNFIKKAAAYILKEIYVNVHILIKLLIIAILCALLQNLQSSFMGRNTGEIAFYVCYIIIVSILFVSFSTALTLGSSIIDSMVAFMQATIPVLVTLLVSGANIVSAGIFQPVLIMVVEISATIIKDIFIPLIFFSTVISFVDNISDKIQIGRLAAFFKQISAWALGILMTLFIGIVAIQGSMGAVVDGITSKTAKFALGAFIPVAGKYLADAADTVIGCALLIKNAAGILAMTGIIVICTVPLLKLLALITLYRITCILVEPISEKRIVNCINEMANSLTFIFGITASVAVMFFISITVLIGAGNISAMIR